MNRIALMVASLILSGSVAGAGTPLDLKAEAKHAATAQKRDARLISAAQERITLRLNDPESARFRGVFVAPNQVAVCGEVNAKNSMGGYVGFRPFISAPDKTGVLEDGTYFVEVRWKERCVAGIIAADDVPH